MGGSRTVRTQGINNNRQCLFNLENKKVEHYERMVDYMMELKDKIIKVAEENGWSVYIEDETEDNICFDFGKYSPAGQDFHV